MAYVYRHIRLDKNEPFYIGIGNDNSYKRAYNKYDRNYIWKNIINKTKYKVEIILDGLSWKEACEKEKEFIEMYGRIDLKTGSLVNLTSGGDGVIGRNPKTQHYIDCLKYKPILQYDLKGNFIKRWNSGVELKKYYTSTQVSNIQMCCRKEYNIVQGYYWYYEENFKKEDIEKSQSFKSKRKKQILVESLDKTFNKIYYGLEECAKDLNLNICEEVIRKKCINRQEYKGYKFQYLSNK